MATTAVSNPLGSLPEHQEREKPSPSGGELGASHLEILAHYANKRRRAQLQAAWDRAVRMDPQLLATDPTKRADGSVQT